MSLLRPTLALALATALSACMGSEHGGGGPAAPTGLVAAELGGGAHLTWTDTSDDELEFAVTRMEEGVDDDYVEIATVPFDTVQFHDATLTSGATYMYMVMSTNDGGEGHSNVVTFVAP